MVFSKQELSFLGEFVACVDTRTELGDKVFIKAQGERVDFIQFSSHLKLFKRLDKKVDKDFTLLVQTSLLFDLLKTFKDDFEFILNAEGISFEGSDSKYTFDSYKITYPETDGLFKMFESDGLNSFEISDLDHIEKARSYLGKDNLEVLGLMDESFVASDKIETLVVSTKNKTEKKGGENIFFIPKEVLALICRAKQEKENPLKSLSIREFDNFWIFELGGIGYLVERKGYGLPYLLNPAYKEKFSAPNKVVVKKKVLIKVLQRMNLFASQNPYTRVHFALGTNSVTISNRDFNKSSETIEIESCDGKLVGQEVIISCASLLAACSDLDGDLISICIEPDEAKRVAYRIEDEHKNIQIILTRIKDG